MLADYINTDFKIMDKVTKPDHDFGGIITVWQDGAPFKGGLVRKNSTDVLIAEQSGVKAIYTLVTSKQIMLTRGMMVKRVADQATFEIKSDSMDMQTPSHAGIQFAQATAERVVL